MASFRTRRTRLETAEQKEIRLSADRQYRRNRLASIRTNETVEEKEKRLARQSQYKVQCLANKRARENEQEKQERLKIQRVKERSRREKSCACETTEER